MEVFFIPTVQHYITKCNSLCHTTQKKIKVKIVFVIVQKIIAILYIKIQVLTILLYSSLPDKNTNLRNGSVIPKSFVILKI